MVCGIRGEAVAGIDGGAVTEVPDHGVAVVSVHLVDGLPEDKGCC